MNGIDDFIIDLIWLIRRRQPDPAPPVNEKKTAIFIPLWQEHEVVRAMVEHNLKAIAYRDYQIILGTYPNDTATTEAVAAIARDHSQIAHAICPHDGPTSKADCLNWIFQRMLLIEEAQRTRFDVIVVHDAEDLIHPLSLREINARLEAADFVQIPVFALVTPPLEWTHGVYCDEFAEYQLRDMHVRELCGTFIPSCGVGTGYRREALERLASADQNRIFDPACLTEDYENGLRLHQLGCKQGFATPDNLTKPIATREYFPREWKAAIRQRSRWITGNVLQTWERHGWRGSWKQRYWFWRDRKGVAGSLLSAVANLITPVLVFASADQTSSILQIGAGCAMFFAVWRMGWRMYFSQSLYGWRFAVAAPLRSVFGNGLNAFACVSALNTYFRAKLKRQPLRWVKTAHLYPNLNVLKQHSRPLEDILVSCCYLSSDDLERAVASCPRHLDFGDHLVATGLLSSEELDEARCLQSAEAAETDAPLQPSPDVARMLPARLIREWQVLPCKVDEGSLHLAGARIPTAEIQSHIRRFTNLQIRFRLVSSAAWKDLAHPFLPIYTDSVLRK